MALTPPRALGVASLAVVTGCAGVARATAFELMGVGPTGIAEVGARAARADDGSAAFYDPAGLGFGKGVRVELAPMLGASALEAQETNLPLESPFGAALLFDATIPFTGALADRIRFGFAGYFLPDVALRIISRNAAAPLYPYYDNRSQRLVVMPALGVRIARSLAIGGGVNVLAGVSGPADVRAGASGATESRIEEQVTTIMRANLGVRWDPAAHVRLALAYRQRFSIPSTVTTTSEVGGVPLAVDVDVKEALFDPDVLVAAASFDAGALGLELDVSYAVWSAYAGPFVDVKAELPGVNIAANVPEPIFRDVVSLRGAATYRAAVGARSAIVPRLGLGFEPTILDGTRQGRSNLVDGDKIAVGLGATVELVDVLPRTVRVGAGASAQLVMSSAQEKVACSRLPCPAGTVAGPNAADPSAGITNPGYPVLRGGGSFWSASLGIGVDL